MYMKGGNINMWFAIVFAMFIALLSFVLQAIIIDWFES